MDETQKEWEAKYAPDKRIAELEAIIAELREAATAVKNKAERIEKVGTRIPDSLHSDINYLVSLV